MSFFFFFFFFFKVQLYLQSSSVEKPSLKSLLQFTSLPFPREEAPLWQHSWGVIPVSFSLFPPVNAMPSKNGLTPHVLRDGGCFHFYPLFKKEKMERTAQLTF
ncbi:hypothetical protein ILYODFUR_033344 [Ilyodon furcidens]|uniref:Secreted protein n=1 Tax=Ilyodon furcidens TaxID=33524 RepID=A0ABV0V095_9TELE